MRRASNSRPVRFAARAGLITSGVVHVLIGALGMSVANGFRGNADQTGALQAVAETPGGVFLLWFATVCLLGLGVWQWTGSLTAGPDTSKIFPRKVRDRFKAVGFAAVGLAALAFAIGGRPNAADYAATLLANRDKDGTSGRLFLTVAANTIDPELGKQVVPALTGNGPRSEANALLIVAAINALPDLLDALEGVTA